MVNDIDSCLISIIIVINGAASITAGRTQNAHVSAGSNPVNIMKISVFFNIVKNSEEFKKRIPLEEAVDADGDVIMQ